MIIFIGIQNLKAKILLSIAFIFVAASGAHAQTCSDKTLTLDHVIWAVPNLEEGMQDFRARTGIEPTFGGEHTNGVTANYLVALGPCLYLEIVGPKQGANVQDLGDRASGYSKPNVSGFAFRYNLNGDKESIAKKLQLLLGEFRDGGRIKPDGTELKWRTSQLIGLDLGAGKFPFIINWLTEPHPAQTLPQGQASLVSLTLAGDGVRTLKEVVEEGDLPMVLQPAGRKGIWMQLDTPKGRVILK